MTTSAQRTRSVSRRELIHAAGAMLAAGSLLSPALSRAGAHAGKPAAAAGTIKVGEFIVNRMGYGAMRLTGDGVWGRPDDWDAAKAVLRQAYELGCNFIDTSDAYGPYVNEEMIAETLYPYPDDLVIATKGGFERSGPNKWTPNGRPEHLRAACEASLKRLKLDAHHVYQLHVPDRNVPLADQIGELSRLQDEGKIREIGVSNFSLDQLREAQNMVKVVSVQNRYNVAIRDSEDVLTACEQDGVAFIPWGPLATRAKDSDVLTRLEEIAAGRDVSKYRAALAWLMTKSDAMLPIPGTSSLDHLADNVAAAALTMSDTEMAALA